MELGCYGRYYGGDYSAVESDEEGAHAKGGENEDEAEAGWVGCFGR